MTKTLVAFLFLWANCAFAAPLALTIPLHGYPQYPIKGTVTLESIPEHKGIRITTVVDGLTPGLHGYHIHEAANCNSIDGSSAKGHYNPHKLAHGAYHANEKHLGDLGNLHADSHGHARSSVFIEDVHLAEEPKLGARSFIIHQDTDDFVSQPSGNSGPRIACATVPLISY